MKRIAFGDVHLSSYKNDSLAEDGLPYRLSSLLKILRKICLYARKKDIKHIDILGDLCNDKNIIYTDAINGFKDIILEFEDIWFLIIAGNHDKSSIGETQTSAADIFKGYANARTLTEPEIIDDCVKVIPWSTKIITDIREAVGYPIMLSHVGLTEGQLQSGISMATSLRMSDLKKFKLVLLGHYHKPQQLKTSKTNLYYTGNLMHLNWNDKNEQKRFIVYDTETLKVQSVALSGFKEFREFIIESKDQIADMMNEANEAKAKGHHVRVRKKIPDEIENTEQLVVVEESVIDPTNRGITMSMSTKEKLDKYLDIKEITDEDERKEYLAIASLMMS